MTQLSLLRTAQDVGKDYNVEQEGDARPFRCYLDVGLARTSTGAKARPPPRFPFVHPPLCSLFCRRPWRLFAPLRLRQRPCV